MQARILRVAIIAILLTVLVLGVPAGFAIARIVTDDERGELQQAALTTALDVSPTYLRGDPVEVSSTEAGLRVGVYSRRGALVAGLGPARLTDAEKRAGQSGVVSTRTHGELVEVVPVSSEERVIAMVRAGSPTSAVLTRVVWWWVGLAGGCLLAGLSAGMYAAHEARRLAQPITGLADSANRLGDGDFSVDPQPSGVPEIDAAGRSLALTARRLADTIARERAFSDHASHQLRTPLTHLQLELEAGLRGDDDAVRRSSTTAMGIADQLSATIDDVLSLARHGEGTHKFDPEPLVQLLADQWRGTLAADGRRLQVDVESTPAIAAAPAATRQVLQVLLDNAHRHGRGTVTIRLRQTFEAVAVDVADDGDAPPIDITASGAMGLAMARSIAVAQHGRLLVDQSDGTRFTLLLPSAQ